MEQEGNGHKIKVIIEDNKQLVFDIIRKKYVVLTPEENVRQHFILFLINEKQYPRSLIAVEKGISYNQMQKRFDIVAFNNQGAPCVMVECKAPEVKITQKTFDQIALYNMSLKVDYLVVTNGTVEYTCKIDHTNKKYEFLKELPSYSDLQL